MHDDINTKRTELANNFAAAGAALLDFGATACAMAAIPDTDPQQYVAAGTPESIAAILPATICPQRRQKHGERPTEPLTFDDAALPADLQQLKALALAADQGEGQHIYTHWRDSNNHKANEAWHLAASPAVVLDLIARIERATAPHAAPPEGFVIVPKIPTRDMVAKTVDIVFDGAVEDADVITEVYAAMLSGAPAAPHGSAAPTEAEKVLCGACKGTGDASVAESFDSGIHKCSDCNGKGYHWEPVEAPQRAAAPTEAASGEFTPMRAYGANICLPRLTGGFEVRNCPNPLALAKFIVDSCNSASQRAAAPVSGDLTTVDCPTCNGHGLIGGHSGQTPESYEEHAEGCGDCDGQGKIIVSRKDLAAVSASQAAPSIDIIASGLREIIASARSLKGGSYVIALADDILLGLSERAAPVASQAAPVGGWEQEEARERIKFEKWAEEANYDLERADGTNWRIPEGSYLSEGTSTAWGIWQACAAVAAAKVPTGEEEAGFHVIYDYGRSIEYKATAREAHAHARALVENGWLDVNVRTLVYKVGAPVEQGQGAARHLWAVKRKDGSGFGDWLYKSKEDAAEWLDATRYEIVELAEVGPVGAGVVPEGLRDCLRRSGANTDYHGLIAFTGAQLESFVGMVAAATAHPANPEGHDA